MPNYEFTRVERVIAAWTVEAATIEDAREKWEQQHNDVHLHSEEVTDVYDAWWKDDAGNWFGEKAEDDQEEDEGDDGCPKSDPDCMGGNGDCHDACETPR